MILFFFYQNDNDDALFWPFPTFTIIIATSGLCMFKTIGEEHFCTVLQMYCGDGKTSSMATLWFSSPESTVKSLFHDSYGNAFI